MASCCCCFRRRAGRRSSGRSSKGVNDVCSGKSRPDDLQSPLSCSSYMSEYYDAQESFPVPEGPSPTSNTNATPRPSLAHDKSTDSPATPKPQGGVAPGPGHTSSPAANGHQHHPHHSHHSPVVQAAAQPQANGTAAPAAAAAPGSPPQQQLQQQPSDAPSTFLTPTVSLAVATTGEPPGGEAFHPVPPSEASEEPLAAGAGTGPMSRFASCLSILESIRIPGSTSTPTATGGAASTTSGPFGAGPPPRSGSEAARGARSRRLGKMEPGCSLRRRDMSVGMADVREAWDECDDGPSGSGRPFMVRGPDYLRTKAKLPSRGALYRLLGSDVISSDIKLTHVARHVNLASMHRPAIDPHLPPLLILTIMLPIYPPAIFGGNDGSSLSLIYYFGLPPDLNLATYENQTALGLLRRFAANGREGDGTPTRDRFKLIPRVVNVDEWAQRGPLSPAEHKLLATYNDKPILTRPQHFFFTGPGYLEVDIDIHTYQFLARKAFSAYFSRLKEVVFENAFVIQGNNPEELPEQVIAAARMYRIDMGRSRPLADFVAHGPAVAAAVAASTPVAAGTPGAAAGAAAPASAGPAGGATAGSGGRKVSTLGSSNGLGARVGSIPEAPEEP